MQNTLHGNYIGRGGRGSLEMQIKSMRYHFTPAKIGVKFLKPDNKCWYWCRETGTLLRCLWECNMIYALWNMTWKFLTRLNIYLFYDPAVTFLGICPREIYINSIHNSLKLEKNPSVHQQGNGWTHYCIFILGNNTQQGKIINYWYIIATLMISWKLGWAKEARYKYCIILFIWSSRTGQSNVGW